MRWAIEVSFAEAKRLLNLGKCQCRDFASQIASTVELTVTEKIWGILMEVIQTIAEAFNFDQDEMMRAIINNNNKELNAVRRAFETLQLAA